MATHTTTTTTTKKKAPRMSKATRATSKRLAAKHAAPIAYAAALKSARTAVASVGEATTAVESATGTLVARLKTVGRAVFTLDEARGKRQQSQLWSDLSISKPLFYQWLTIGRAINKAGDVPPSVDSPSKLRKWAKETAPTGKTGGGGNDKATGQPTTDKRAAQTPDQTQTIEKKEANPAPRTAAHARKKAAEFIGSLDKLPAGELSKIIATLRQVKEIVDPLIAAHDEATEHAKGAKATK